MLEIQARYCSFFIESEYLAKCNAMNSSKKVKDASRAKKGEKAKKSAHKDTKKKGGAGRALEIRITKPSKV